MNSLDYWHHAREVYAKAFESLTYHLQETVIQGNQVLFVTDLNKYYQALIHEIGGDGFIDSCPTTQKLVEKLEKHYTTEIQITKGSAKGTPMIIYNAAMSLEEAIKDQSLNMKINNENAKVRDVAFSIRKAILSAETKKLTNKITQQDISNGEVEVPNILHHFLEYLIGGPDSRRVNTRKQHRISSIVQDSVFSHICPKDTKETSPTWFSNEKPHR